MTKKKIWILSALFLTVLTGFRFIWLQYNSTAQFPAASAGVLDLRNWDSLTEHSLPLNGEWEFYPGTFRYRSGTPPADMRSPGESIQVPGNWTFRDRPFGNDKYGFGTYRLKILVDPAKGKSYGVRIPTVNSSSEVYVNGQLLGHSGRPDVSNDRYVPHDVPYTSYFTLNGEDEIELVIQAANFDNTRHGGIVRPVKFGLESVLRKDLNFSQNMVWIACVAYAIHVLYGFVLYLVGGRDKRLIYFSLMILCVILATLLDGERLLFAWIPFSFEWSLKFIYPVGLFGGYMLHRLIKDKLPQRLQRRPALAYELLCGIAFLSVLFLPLSAVLATEGLYLALIFVPCLFTPVVMYRSTAKIDSDNIFLLLAALAAMSSMAWFVVLNITQIEMTSYPFDLIIAMICFSAYWFKRFFRLSDESRQLADALRQADKQKDDFLSTVAHELRNPLHGMINISQSVSEREQHKLGSHSVDDLQMIVKVGRRMSHMLNDLLDMARLKDNRIRLALAGVSVHGVASSVIDMLRFMVEGKPIRLVNRIPADFPLVHADEDRLNQILFNLLHNAVKYTHEGEVSVQAEIRNGWASVSIADTGIGMDEKLLDRVFEPYEQASSDGGTLRGGFGLGLGICKRLVEMHGGTLTVRSKPNEGSVFAFSLKLVANEAAEGSTAPLIATAAAEAAAASEDGRAVDARTAAHAEPLRRFTSDRIRLLAVDDDPVNLNVMRTIFSDEVHEVITASNGDEALKLLETGRWDLIISDVTMPIMSGYELTRRIRERYSVAELPVLLLTANNRDEDIETGFLSGANDYVAKPVNATELKIRARSLTNLKKTVNDRLRMEAALLQAQIKPHFMINTFNAVSALSKIDTDKMDVLIEELSNYFRLGIDFHNTEQTVPLARELKLIRSYLYIQKERFEDRLQVVWEVDDQVNLYIPPLTIQPLVENAVTHGILKRKAGGEVRIRIADLGLSVEICVSDNGVGMDEEKVKHLLDRKADGRTGIGLFNTDRRLKQFYGRGLTISSELGAGTSVSFTIAKAE